MEIPDYKSRDLGITVRPRRWTETATECYERGCNCEGCFYKTFFTDSHQKCRMKATVIELVRLFGIPEKHHE